ncbi:MAG TPA: aminopeptidase P family N-terminal domain-containing protein, partial [Acidimicrobiales bacterium]|nr:aminopeptidase P family N-terminal domain-containing protein [Acidimicrobiales bacterium]
MNTTERLKKLTSNFEEVGCEAFFVTKLINIRYLTGFTGSAGKLWVTKDKAVLFTDGRYAEQAPAETESGEIEVVIQVQGFDRTLNELSEGVTRLGLEAASITWEQQNQIAEWLPSI